MAQLSCIKDVPIIINKQALTEKSLNEVDTLNAFRYAEALAKFIMHADTPVTIGIQGGWGSGKTSLFSIIQAELDDDVYRQIKGIGRKETAYFILSQNMDKYNETDGENVADTLKNLDMDARLESLRNFIKKPPV